MSKELSSCTGVLQGVCQGMCRYVTKLLALKLGERASLVMTGSLVRWTASPIELHKDYRVLSLSSSCSPSPVMGATVDTNRKASLVTLSLQSQ